MNDSLLSILPIKRTETYIEVDLHPPDIHTIEATTQILEICTSSPVDQGEDQLESLHRLHRCRHSQIYQLTLPI